MALRALFFGTPAFAVPTLAAMIASAHEVVGVYTQPDRPRGRGQKLEPTPVKRLALSHGLPVLQPEKLRNDDVLTQVRGFGADVAVVVAYGRILPGPMLEIPRFGFINVHASILPRWRGAAPIHRAVMAGDAETGVTIMQVVPALDAGPMIDIARIPIARETTTPELETQLAAIGGERLVAVLDRLAAGRVTATPQDDALVTYAAKLEKHESQVDWSQSAEDIHNRVRGLQPWPLAAAMLHGKRVIFRQSVVTDRPGIAGVVSQADSDGIMVGTGRGSLVLRVVQPEGKAAMPVASFLNGHSVQPGDRFEPLPAVS